MRVQVPPRPPTIEPATAGFFVDAKKEPNDFGSVGLERQCPVDTGRLITQRVAQQGQVPPRPPTIEPATAGFFVDAKKEPNDFGSVGLERQCPVDTGRLITQRVAQQGQVPPRPPTIEPATAGFFVDAKKEPNDFGSVGLERQCPVDTGRLITQRVAQQGQVPPRPPTIEPATAGFFVDAKKEPNDFGSVGLERQKRERLLFVE